MTSSLLTWHVKLYHNPPRCKARRKTSYPYELKGKVWPHILNKGLVSSVLSIMFFNLKLLLVISQSISSLPILLACPRWDLPTLSLQVLAYHLGTRCQLMFIYTWFSIVAKASCLNQTTSNHKHIIKLILLISHFDKLSFSSDKSLFI